jgi:hypothetical protein
MPASQPVKKARNYRAMLVPLGRRERHAVDASSASHALKLRPVTVRGGIKVVAVAGAARGTDAEAVERYQCGAQVRFSIRYGDFLGCHAPILAEEAA